MCGIAGYIGKEPISKERIDKTLSLMKSRGPNCQKFVKDRFEDNEVALLHSRISIIDIDKRSDQPFSKDNLLVPCTKYKIAGYCKDNIKNLLNNKDSKVYYLEAIHIREYQYQEYLDAFKELGFTKSVIVSDLEVELVKFEK